MTFIHAHAIWFAIGWPIVALVCGLIVARIIRHNEQSYPTVYDQEDSAERAPSELATSGSWDGRGSLDAARRKRLAERSTDPDGLDFQDSWERDSGHGASW